ncbi:MAG TPA: hypothetical protein V6D10_23565 [Trichocoleus sp.]
MNQYSIEIQGNIQSISTLQIDKKYCRLLKPIFQFEFAKLLQAEAYSLIPV